ncbi:helix-turn-helix domain-containing protein [Cytobacillus pseudoceanisediminis]|uniref:helix-turn-helix domain-containing protein n=1 Tax=Cytobacillus pseudoceanisediminis TaxID=3051614 RepID=UPI003C2B1FA8
MNVLILLRDKNEGYERQLEHLFSSFKATVLNDLEAAINVTKKVQFKLAVVFGKVLTTSWNIRDLQRYCKCPILFLSELEELNEWSLVSCLEHFKTESTTDPQNNSLFSQSLEYIEKNLFNEDLSLEKVAAHIYVSKCHYSRMFQKEVGEGFKKYVITKRINKAKRLLQEGEAVTNVCYSVGYNDLTHFGRMFKKVVGVNPSEYRQYYIGNRRAQ